MNDEPHEGEDQGNADNLGSDPEVPIVHIPPSEHPHHPTVETHHRHHYIKRAVDFIRDCTDFVRRHKPSAEGWNAIASFITAGATIVMVLVYIQIRGIMDSQGGQTNKLIDAANIQACSAQKIADASDRNASSAGKFAASADSINNHTKDAVGEFERLATASERSAKATETNLAHATETLEQTRIEQRAWVAVGRQLLQGTTVTIEIANSGKTPAFEVATGVRFGANWCCDLHVQHRSLRIPVTDNRGILTPGASLTATMDVAESLMGVEEKYKSKTVHQILGTIEYRDAFHIPHWTNFCLLVQGFPNLTISQFCEGGNDTDDNPEPMPPPPPKK